MVERSRGMEKKRPGEYEICMGCRFKVAGHGSPLLEGD